MSYSLFVHPLARLDILDAVVWYEEALVHRSAAPRALAAQVRDMRSAHREGQVASKKSKVHPSYKTRYKIRNWASYDQALVRRGDLTLWLSPTAVKAWTALPSLKPGGQRHYSDVAIEAALMLRLVFGLPWRQTEGLLNSVLTLMKLRICSPDHTTLSRRSRGLGAAIPLRPAGESVHVILDATGLKVFGRGEWAAAKHGVG